MKKFNFLINQLGLESYVGRKEVQPDSVSLASRIRVLGILLVLLTVFSGSVWGTDVDSGTSKFTAVSGSLDANISYASAKAGGTSNPAINSSNIRLYRKTTSAPAGLGSTLTVTAASGYKITAITFTLKSSLGYSVSVDGGSASTGSNSTIALTSLTATYVTLQNYSTSQMDVTRIQVTYQSNCSGTKLGTPVVTASPSSNRVDLSWPAVANASSYQLKWNGGDWTSATSPVSKTGLTNGTSYTYQVKAIGNGSIYCDGDPSEEASAIPGTYYTVTFMCNGSTYATKSILSGSHLKLPDNPSPCMAGKEFVGWATASISGSTNTKPTFASTFTTISSNKTYYAVFATKTANSYSLGDANDLIEGQKVLIVNQNAKYAMANTGDDNGSLDATSVTISSSKISSPGSSLVWTVELDGAKYKFKSTHYIYDGGGSGSSHNTNLWCDEEDVDYPDSWTISSAGSTGKYYLNSDRSTGRKLEYWSSTFTTYASGTTEAFKHSFFVPTYTGYITTCCTPLGSINGSVLWTAYFM